MTTHRMSVRKFIKNTPEIRTLVTRGEFEEVRRILTEKEYAGFNFQHVDAEVYIWCHKQFGTKNWVKLGREIWFTNNSYHAMFALQWMGTPRAWRWGDEN